MSHYIIFCDDSQVFYAPWQKFDLMFLSTTKNVRVTLPQHITLDKYSIKENLGNMNVWELEKNSDNTLDGAKFKDISDGFIAAEYIVTILRKHNIIYITNPNKIHQIVFKHVYYLWSNQNS